MTFHGLAAQQRRPALPSPAVARPRPRRWPSPRRKLGSTHSSRTIPPHGTPRLRNLGHRRAVTFHRDWRRASGFDSVDLAAFASVGTDISASMPARAAYVATAVPAFPEESSTTRSTPSSAARVSVVAPVFERRCRKDLFELGLCRPRRRVGERRHTFAHRDSVGCVFTECNEAVDTPEAVGRVDGRPAHRVQRDSGADLRDRLLVGSGELYARYRRQYNRVRLTRIRSRPTGRRRSRNRVESLAGLALTVPFVVSSGRYPKYWLAS